MADAESDAKRDDTRRAGEAVIELLLRLNREAGTTLVMVTHDEHLAQRSTRILRLAAGRIVV